MAKLRNHKRKKFLFVSNMVNLVNIINNFLEKCVFNFSILMIDFFDNNFNFVENFKWKIKKYMMYIFFMFLVLYYILIFL